MVHSNMIRDSGFGIRDSGFWILDSGARRYRLLVGAHGEILEVGQLLGLGVERFAQPCHVLLRLNHLPNTTS